MRRDGFVSRAMAVFPTASFPKRNLETTPPCIRRMQQATRAKETVWNGHFEKCHSSLGYFLHAALRYR